MLDNVREFWELVGSKNRFNIYMKCQLDVCQHFCSILAEFRLHLGAFGGPFGLLWGSLGTTCDSLSARVAPGGVQGVIWEAKMRSREGLRGARWRVWRGSALGYVFNAKQILLYIYIYYVVLFDVLIQKHVCCKCFIDVFIYFICFVCFVCFLRFEQRTNIYIYI